MRDENGNWVNVPDYQGNIVPYVAQAGQAASGSGLRNMFRNFKIPNLRDLNTARANLVSRPIFGSAGGPSIANIANVGGGIYHGINALQGLNQNSDTAKDIDSLVQDINTMKVTNPMYDMYMDPSDEKLMRQIKNGSLESGKFSNAVGGALESIPQALLNAGLGFLTGNIPGAVIQGVGTLANAGIQGYNKGQQDVQSKLQGLYNKLSQANEEYRSMRRPNGLRQAGLQSRYYNQLY